MIAKLTGLMDTIGDGFLILDVNGVGYRVFCSNQTLAKCSAKGMNMSLFIETQVREDHIHLFGFADAAEKEWFTILTNVQGVGAKVGLAILSALTPNDLNLALATGDSKLLTRASGVGPKLAVRIVTELKGKAGTIGCALGEMPVITGEAVSGAMNEAISALVNLGYGRSEAGLVVGTVLKSNPQANVSDVIRLSLKEIGQNHG